MLIWSIIALAACVMPGATYAATLPAPTETPIDTPDAHARVISLINIRAAEYGLSDEMTARLKRTLWCESRYDDTRVGPYGELGIAQIYLIAHPEITDEQAMSDQWAIEYAAKMFASGHARMWSCYNIFYPAS